MASPSGGLLADRYGTAPASGGLLAGNYATAPAGGGLLAGSQAMAPPSGGLLTGGGLLADNRAMAPASGGLMTGGGLLADNRAMAPASGGLMTGGGLLANCHSMADSHAMAPAGGGLLTGLAESRAYVGAQAAALQAVGAPGAAMPAGPQAPPPGPGDGALELFYVGELELGEQFPGLSEDDGLFVDYEALAGEDWLPIAKQEGYVGQTQTAYPDADGVHVFSHPIDFHYISTSIAGWPQLHLQVLKLDETGRVVAVSFGSLTLPCTPGHSELVCRTWSPMSGSCLDEARATYMGGPPGALLAARAEVLAAKLPEARTQMATRTSGKVHVSLDTIFRNAKAHGIHQSR